MHLSKISEPVNESVFYYSTWALSFRLVQCVDTHVRKLKLSSPDRKGFGQRSVPYSPDTFYECMGHSHSVNQIVRFFSFEQQYKEGIFHVSLSLRTALEESRVPNFAPAVPQSRDCERVAKEPRSVRCLSHLMAQCCYDMILCIGFLFACHLCDFSTDEVSKLRWHNQKHKKGTEHCCNSLTTK